MKVEIERLYFDISDSDSERETDRDVSIYGLSGNWRDRTIADQAYVTAAFLATTKDRKGKTVHGGKVYVHIRNNIGHKKITVATHQKKLRDLFNSFRSAEAPLVDDFMSAFKKADLIIARSRTGLGVHCYNHGGDVDSLESNLKVSRLANLTVNYSINIPHQMEQYSCNCGEAFDNPTALSKHRARCNTVDSWNAFHRQYDTHSTGMDTTLLFDTLTKYGLIEWRPLKMIPVVSKAAEQYLDLISMAKDTKVYGDTPLEQLKGLLAEVHSKAEEPKVEVSDEVAKSFAPFFTSMD